MRFTELAMGAQTAYSELMEQAHALELQASLSGLPGKFHRRQISRAGATGILDIGTLMAADAWFTWGRMANVSGNWRHASIGRKIPQRWRLNPGRRSNWVVPPHYRSTFASSGAWPNMDFFAPAPC